MRDGTFQKSALTLLLRYTLAFLLIGLLWEAASRAAGESLLPSPVTTALLFFQSLSDPVYIGHLVVSLKRLIYGLTAGQYRRLEPYIRISDDYRPAAEAYPAEPRPAYVRDTTRYPLKLKPGQHVALNTADTALLKRVPGIGSGFARAIVRYRERLGGFYSTAQLMEIGNFPQSALPYFTADPSLCRKLNVNRLTLSQLRRHPYIGFYQAKTIIDHRRLHGPLRSLDDLRLYKDFPPETIERLRNYIEF